ncbi:MAG: CbiX/SirB N-terminal domain-containing protein [Gammaproteobacteria bacterium]|nr:CbiX/SirB N-terminal domain-containing protein [Gammaproteobacteria bacterium]
MDALLLIAHGSRREASNDEVRELTRELVQKSKRKFSIVECAFLELAIPSIPEGVTICVQKGANSITVLPYFLSAGRHVAVDIPEELGKAMQLHPQLEIKVAPYLGSANEISSILVSLSKQAA